MRAAGGRPVFLTGAPRSGTSWLGALLARHPRLRYRYEPLNHHWNPRLRGVLEHFEYLAPDGTPAPLLAAEVRRAMAGRQSLRQLARAAYRGYLRTTLRPWGRVLAKDPTAALMTGWIARRLGAGVAIIHRHPCAVASSLDALGFPFSVPRLLSQERLMRDHLGAFEDLLRRVAADRWLSLGAFWGALHHVLLCQRRQFPSWCLVEYETLCLDPARVLKALAIELELTAPQLEPLEARGPHARALEDPGSLERDSRAMVDVWRHRLSPGQIDAVTGVVAEFGFERRALERSVGYLATPGG